MIKSVTQHSYFEKKPNKYLGRFQNNPSIGWLHPKFTHAHPLAWTNKKLAPKPITLSIQQTFDSSTPTPARKVFPQCLCKTEPIN